MNVRRPLARTEAPVWTGSMVTCASVFLVSMGSTVRTTRMIASPVLAIMVSALTGLNRTFADVIQATLVVSVALTSMSANPTPVPMVAHAMTWLICSPVTAQKDGSVNSVRST